MEINTFEELYAKRNLLEGKKVTLSLGLNYEYMCYILPYRTAPDIRFRIIEKTKPLEYLDYDYLIPCDKGTGFHLASIEYVMKENDAGEYREEVIHYHAKIPSRTWYMVVEDEGEEE